MMKQATSPINSHHIGSTGPDGGGRDANPLKWRASQLVGLPAISMSVGGKKAFLRETVKMKTLGKRQRNSGT